jgi:hypothetical protein
MSYTGEMFETFVAEQIAFLEGVLAGNGPATTHPGGTP